MPLPSRERLAHHEAGHAVIQHWLARGRYRVVRVSLESVGDAVAGQSLIDREVQLGLYEFGLLTLAGIAAENRYAELFPEKMEEEPWGAVGDIREWLAVAEEQLESRERVDLVTRNVLKRLAEFFADPDRWGSVTALAGHLLAAGVVEEAELQEMLRRCC